MLSEAHPLDRAYCQVLEDTVFIDGGHNVVMEYTRLGSTGLHVSQLCLGTWRFGRETDGVVETTREETHELLDAAWEYGINFIDTADRYGSPHGTAEQLIGEWLAEYDREDFVLASKVYFPFNGRDPDRGPGPNDSGLGRNPSRRRWRR